MRTNAVSVAALTDDRHAGQVYELTGPRLLTFADAVGEIAQATGTAMRYPPVSVEDFVDYARRTAHSGVWQVAV